MTIPGLNLTKLLGYPPIQDVLPRFASFIGTLPSAGCVYVVAHGGKRFDFPLLQQELQRTGGSLQLPPYVTVDSLAIFRSFARAYEGGWLDTGYGLDAVSKR